MGADQNIDWRGAIASALEWWRDAGVDVLVEDAAFPWLDAPAPVALSAPPVTPALVEAPAPAALPASMEAFATWRTGAEAPEARWGGPVFAAAGPADAALMVLVDCPERGDRERLLEGECGQLLDNMLRAIGMTRDAVLLASVCTRRPTTGRVPRDAEARLGEIARHHVGLAAPKRVLLLGDAATRAVLETNVAAARGRLHSLNLNDGKTTTVVASHHPRTLLERPACKSEAWKDLLMLIEGLDR